jgi:cysteine desulfurase
MTVYLDYAATTPLDDRVLQSMLPYFQETFGNPSSIHQPGQSAERAVEQSRQMIAGCLGADPAEIVFTSCGTESDNLALRGVAFAERQRRNANHILTTPVEHHAVLHTVHQLHELHGFEVEYLPVDEYGMVDPDDVKKHIRKETAIISVIYANNEIGTINPVAEIGLVCQQQGVAFHTDAVQAVAHLDVNVHKEHIGLLALGAHKFYGPKGVGALYVKKGTNILPIQTGGKQEFGMRAGTQNVPYIVGMANALMITKNELTANSARLSALRNRIIGQVLEEIPESQLTGHPIQRLPNHASFVFRGVDGNELLMLLDLAGFACSSGSACKVGNPTPSEVLTSIGLTPDWALGSLRVTLGRQTTTEQVEAFITTLKELVLKARRL